MEATASTPETAGAPEPTGVAIKSGPRRAKPMAIAGHDEASLSWYFGQGLSIYDRSTFGAVIDRLALDAFGSGPCARCDGTGILEDGGFAVANRCRSCAGTGKIADGHKWCPSCAGYGSVEPYEYGAEHGGWCPGCRGTGSRPIERRAQRRPPCTVCQRGPGRRSCAHCLGTGQEPLSARPAPRSTEGTGAVPDDSALTRFAITSRRVEALRERAPSLVRVLGVYYGDVGQRWAKTEHGRIFSLYHLTPAGKKLARWDERGSATDLHLTPQERIGVQATLQSAKPKRERRALLDGAGTQARELYRRAAHAWVEARPDPVLIRLAKRLRGMGHGRTAALISAHARAGR